MMIRSMIFRCLIIGLALSTVRGVSVQAQGILHTYYDDNDSSEDNLALLQYWQQSWQAVGWETVVLNSSHVIYNLNDHDSMNMQQHRSCLHKWIAMSMSTRGGHYCHWDVLPLTRRKSPENNQDINDPAAFVPFHSNFNSTALPDRLVVYEVIAPSCMSGSLHAWQNVTRALNRHAQTETHFWTDALALIDLRDQVSFQRGVLQLDDSLLFFTSPKQHNPCHNLQKHVHRKHKWAVQFSPATLQRARYIPDEWKYPERRLDVARSWFQDYFERCHSEER